MPGRQNYKDRIRFEYNIWDSKATPFGIGTWTKNRLEAARAIRRGLEVQAELPYSTNRCLFNETQEALTPAVEARAEEVVWS